MSSDRNSLDRRSMLKLLAKSSAALSLQPVSLFAQDPDYTGSKRKLAIVGAGMGGIASAYFSDESLWDVDLFEKREKIGGHADSITVDYKGHPLAVDLGAEFFHPDTHPLYIALLESMGLVQKSSVNDSTLRATGSLTVFDGTQGNTIFNSLAPLNSIYSSINFAIYTRYARSLIEDDYPWTLGLGEWLDGLFLSRHVKDTLLRPWLSSLIGSTYQDAEVSSARSILQTFALAFPKNLLNGAITYNSKIGLQGYLDTMLAASPHVNLKLNTAIMSAGRRDSKWYLRSPYAESGPYDAVIFNAPAFVVRDILQNVPETAELQEPLAQFTTFPTTIKIHSDPIYMPQKESDWCVYNAAVGPEACEGSVWLGGIHPKINGSPVRLFKSWTHHRDTQPREVLAERTFRHPHITTDSMLARRQLGEWQGRENLFFASQYTTGTDLQESALFSGLQTAAALSPGGRRYQAFMDKVLKDGKSEIEYLI